MTESRRREHVLAAFEQDRPALTIELAKLHLAAQPDDRTVLLIYGEALSDVGRYQEANVVLQRALALSVFGERDIPLRLIGHMYNAAGNTQAAESAFHEAIDALPDHAAAYIYLGAVLARQGRLAEAEAEAIHVRATGCVDGAIDEAFLNLGLVQRARGDYLGALKSLREAARRDPDDPDTLAALRDVEAVLFEFPTE